MSKIQDTRELDRFLLKKSVKISLHLNVSPSRHAGSCLFDQGPESLDPLAAASVEQVSNTLHLFFAFTYINKWRSKAIFLRLNSLEAVDQYLISGPCD